MAQTVKDLPVMQETWVWSLDWEDPLEKGMATYSSILDWRIPWTEEPGDRKAYSPWGHKESDTPEKLALHFHIIYVHIQMWEARVFHSYSSFISIVT